MSEKFKGKTDSSTISGRLRLLGYKTYEQYLASEHWREVKHRFRESGLPQNCPCGSRTTELHHKTYERLGRERLDDLEALCRRCHKQRHRKAKPPPKPRQYKASTPEARRERTTKALAEWQALEDAA